MPTQPCDRRRGLVLLRRLLRRLNGCRRVTIADYGWGGRGHLLCRNRLRFCVPYGVKNETAGQDEEGSQRFPADGGHQAGECRRDDPMVGEGGLRPARTKRVARTANPEEPTASHPRHTYLRQEVALPRPSKARKDLAMKPPEGNARTKQPRRRKRRTLPTRRHRNGRRRECRSHTEE